MRRDLVGAVFIVVGALACVGSGAESERMSLEDLPPAEYAEVSRIGGFAAEGPYALGEVRAAALLPSTELLAVVDGMTQQIHYFDRGGEYIRTIGGRGGGPGEARALRAIAGGADGSLCAWDAQESRATRFDSEGAVAGTARADLHSIQRIFPSFVGFFDDCSFVLRDQRETMGMNEEPEGMRRDTLRFVHFSASGQVIGELARVSDTEKWFKNRDGAWGHVDLIFGDELMAFVSDSRLWYGSSASFRWDRLDIVTGAIDSLHLALPIREATPDEVEAERERRLDGVVPLEPGKLILDGVDASERLAEDARNSIRAVPARGELPAYDRAVPGNDGAVWLREYPRPDARDARWVLLAPSDELVAQVTLPRATDVLDGTLEWLVLLGSDEFDAPVVRVLRLNTPDP